MGLTRKSLRSVARGSERRPLIAGQVERVGCGQAASGLMMTALPLRIRMV
jgi:hypothetical protein